MLQRELYPTFTSQDDDDTPGDETFSDETDETSETSPDEETPIDEGIDEEV